MANEVQKVQADPASALISTMESQWALVLPKHVTPERFARVALTCIRKNPKLAEALKTSDGKASLMSAFMRCAEVGLEPDGIHAHLIPFGNEIQLIFDFKGLLRLAMQSGLISRIHTDMVCENDEFEYNKGEVTVHKPNLKERGEPYAYYCEVLMKDGSKVTEVCTMADIKKIQASSKSKNSPAWRDWFDQMARKSVFRRCSKWLPLSGEIQKHFYKDDDVVPMQRATVVKSNAVDVARNILQVAAPEPELVQTEVVDELQEIMVKAKELKEPIASKFWDRYDRLVGEGVSELESAKEAWEVLQK